MSMSKECLTTELWWGSYNLHRESRYCQANPRDVNSVETGSIKLQIALTLNQFVFFQQGSRFSAFLVTLKGWGFN
jgi:hypothetical protein